MEEMHRAGRAERDRLRELSKHATLAAPPHAHHCLHLITAVVFFVHAGGSSAQRTMFLSELSPMALMPPPMSSPSPKAPVSHLLKPRIILSFSLMSHPSHHTFLFNSTSKSTLNRHVSLHLHTQHLVHTFLSFVTGVFLSALSFCSVLSL